MFRDVSSGLKTVTAEVVDDDPYFLGGVAVGSPFTFRSICLSKVNNIASQKHGNCMFHVALVEFSIRPREFSNIVSHV